jgi:hypothetical protein
MPAFLAVAERACLGPRALRAVFAYMSAPMSRPFLKMNGLGNDFVVV